MPCINLESRWFDSYGRLKMDRPLSGPLAFGVVVYVNYLQVGNSY